MCDLMKCKVCGQVKPPAREYRGESLCAECEQTEAGFKVYVGWMNAAVREVGEDDGQDGPEKSAAESQTDSGSFEAYGVSTRDIPENL